MLTNRIEKGDYIIKGLKRHRDHEGGMSAFNCNLYKKNKKIAEIDDDGWGGGAAYRFTDKDEEKAFFAFLNTIPKQESEFFPEGLEVCLDIWVAAVLDDMEETKYYKSRCRKKTLVHYDDNIYELDVKWEGERTKAAIKKASWAQGKKIVFLNEIYGAA